jgi:hypothetical protein
MMVNKFKIKFILSGFLVATSLACAPFNQENIYGNGKLPSSEDETIDLSSQNEPEFDYQGYQVNFMTISASPLSYSITDTLSYLKLQGNCFNPGFSQVAIYYKALDAAGSTIAADGMPYASNISYYPGTSLLQPGYLTCNAKGLWSTIIQIPTALFYQLDGGEFEVAMVVWHKNQELHNDETGVTYIPIKPPPLPEPTAVNFEN